ncbi:MAG: hypothetical protein H6562_17890 [Lewinellaceae bacterium]|nr:hypothetical protein [Lewinella sp.]MCB9280769.1 hypothetical protein [Lewinellaceae bacterium]
MRSRIPVFLFIAGLFSGCLSDKPGGENDSEVYKVSLVCESRSGSTEETPAAGVFAIVNANKTKIANVSVCDSLTTANFQDLAIPQDALTAVGGWWAGSGDYFYARRGEENEILFYHGAIDEMSETPSPDYQVIATFSNGKFYFPE